jgi:hypothetical protein
MFLNCKHKGKNNIKAIGKIKKKLKRSNNKIKKKYKKLTFQNFQGQRM